MFVFAQLRDVAPAVRMGERAAAAQKPGIAPAYPVELVPTMAQVKALGLSKAQFKAGSSGSMGSSASSAAEGGEGAGEGSNGGGGGSASGDLAAAAQAVVKSRATAAMARLQEEMTRLSLSGDSGEERGASGGTGEEGAAVHFVAGVSLGLLGGGGDTGGEEEGGGEPSESLYVEGFRLGAEGGRGASQASVSGLLGLLQGKRGAALQAYEAVPGAEAGRQIKQEEGGVKGEEKEEEEGGEEGEFIHASAEHLRRVTQGKSLRSALRGRKGAVKQVAERPITFNAPFTDFTRDGPSRRGGGGQGGGGGRV